MRIRRVISGYNSATQSPSDEKITQSQLARVQEQAFMEDKTILEAVHIGN